MSQQLDFRTVVISDVHLGTPDCKADQVNHFLSSTRCHRLILNGDIIDGWRLTKSGRWTEPHSRFVRLILSKVAQGETEVVYLRGNHDGFLNALMPLCLGQIRVQEDYEWETQFGRYLVLHGDCLDIVTRHAEVLAHLGDWGYRVLLRLNRLYNWWRALRGADYFSISREIKARVKSAVNFISKFEEGLTKLARSRGCQGVVCGHIHVPADRYIDEVRYLNCGDWVETMSAVVEHLDGRVELLTYTDFCSRLAAVPRPPEPVLEPCGEAALAFA
ncbi:MAG: UDP-2,3-diacylglucosamine diphosphatase [Verrucomicrobiales bacterium]|nr:UDP-2,3-diacylglucosamine diphosphatase [Verrucomicrobiales bacterium]